MPRLSYGLETLILSKPEMTSLEDHYKHSLRQIQHLPKATATPALYLLMGVPPMEAQLHIRIINFLASALRRPQSIEYRLIERN